MLRVTLAAPGLATVTAAVPPASEDAELPTAHAAVAQEIEEGMVGTMQELRVAAVERNAALDEQLVRGDKFLVILAKLYRSTIDQFTTYRTSCSLPYEHDSVRSKRSWKKSLKCLRQRFVICGHAWSPHLHLCPTTYEAPASTPRHRQRTGTHR
jgi:hypothetical protein